MVTTVGLECIIKFSKTRADYHPIVFIKSVSIEGRCVSWTLQSKVYILIEENLYCCILVVPWKNVNNAINKLDSPHSIFYFISMLYCHMF
jgi:hypothetical protein